MEYTCYVFALKNFSEENTEILTALLGELPFEMFETRDQRVFAYLQTKDDQDDVVSEINHLKSIIPFEFEKEKVVTQNWNKEWESNFSPVVIEEKIYIRAEFHAPATHMYELIIQPEMSFGTGHHETTSQILALMLNIDFKNKTVCDMGCGTGILAVMAEKLGASSIDAVDFDPQCVTNAQLNIVRNNCIRISIYQGDANWLRNKSYDVFIANINRNIILNDLKAYKQSINENGSFICSGFYESDLEEIHTAATTNKLQYKEHRVKNKWCAAVFTKT